MFFSGIILSFSILFYILKKYSHKIKHLLDDDLNLEEMESCRVGEVILQSKRFDAKDLFLFIKQELSEEGLSKYLALQRDARINGGAV